MAYYSAINRNKAVRPAAMVRLESKAECEDIIREASMSESEAGVSRGPGKLELHSHSLFQRKRGENLQYVSQISVELKSNP